MRLFDFPALFVTRFRILPVSTRKIRTHRMHVVPIDLGAASCERLDERRHAEITGLEIPQQQLMIELVVTLGFYDGDMKLRIGC